MPVATLQALVCIRSASGIDSGVFQSFSQLPPQIVPSDLGIVLDALRALPGVLEAIDAARSDPDDLYVTLQTVGNRDLAVWPGPGQSVDMLPDQSAALGVTVEFGFSQNVSLFDHDFSSDDHLGSVIILASEQGEGEIAKLASSAVEGSAYYVIYRVD